jgi:hypothetical protein
MLQYGEPRAFLAKRYGEKDWVAGWTDSIYGLQNPALDSDLCRFTYLIFLTCPISLSNARSPLVREKSRPPRNLRVSKRAKGEEALLYW